MARIVALDVGRKRTGIAVTDPEQVISTGLTTLPTGEIADFLVQYLQQEPVEALVVGAPRTVRNEVSEAERYIEPLINRIRKLLPQLPLHRYDERFTSILAHRILLEGGATKQQRRDKGLVDKVSATLILESYLESRERKQSL